jgi:hypothetical protein
MLNIYIIEEYLKSGILIQDSVDYNQGGIFCKTNFPEMCFGVLSSILSYFYFKMTDTAYWSGWPSKGEYYKDMVWAYKVGAQYLNKIARNQTDKKKCVVFDIDDTLVFGDPDEAIGVREMELGTHGGQQIFILPRNEPIVKLADHAKKLGFTIVVLTARPKESRAASITNMNMLHIPYDALIMNEGDHDPCFKINVRRKIALKYDVALTVGDQVTDCICPGGNTASIKLPDPTSKFSYAWIPP